MITSSRCYKLQFRTVLLTLSHLIHVDICRYLWQGLFLDLCHRHLLIFYKCQIITNVKSKSN